MRDSRTVPTLNALHPQEFEQLVDYLLVRQGNVVVSKHSQDTGVDFVANAPDGSYVGVDVLTRIRRDRIDSLLLRLQRGRAHFDRLLIVTLADLSMKDLDYLRSESISVIDRSRLIEMLSLYGVVVES